MRKILTTIALGVSLLGHAQSVTAEHLADVAPDDKAAARSITLTGTLHRQHREPGHWVGLNDDFRQLRDLCFNVERLDLSQAQIDTIPDCAFHSMHQLREVILPSTLKCIGHQAFYACDGLERIEVLAPAPPTVLSNAFGGIDLMKVKLSVPDSAFEAYAHRPGWSSFFRPVERRNTPVFTSLDGLLPIPERVEQLSDTFDPNAAITTRINPALPAEGYHLRALGDSIIIEGGDAAGIFYGRMTLLQLLPRRTFDPFHPDDSRIDALAETGHIDEQARPLGFDIVDAPRTPIRELMIDPARIFIPFDDLKGFVAEMARYKMNTLHLHLVDDQAWRIEIKAYPELTERSSFRVGMDDMLRPIGGYYTQDQMRELCAYAAQYHVTIVPEIELPGHEVAAIHAFPWLTCQQDVLPLRTTCGVSNELLCPSRETTYTFLSTVLRELADVFPGPYVHLGGDEAGNPALDCWTHCPSCQALKAELFEKDGKPAADLVGKREGNWRLQQYMFDRVIALLRDELGKTPMFWYETDFRQIQPGCITFAWRHGLTQAAIDAAMRCDAKIILCPGEHCYLDYPMGYNDMPEVNWGMPTTTLEQTYSLDPAWGNGSEFEDRCLMGVAGTLWTECIPSTERLYYMAYPRALALAEAGWSQQSRRSWADFRHRAFEVSLNQLRRGICTDWKYITTYDPAVAKPRRALQRQQKNLSRR